MNLIGSLTPPTYLPDIGPLDYHLFRSMQRALSEKWFCSDEKVIKLVDEWIASKEPELFYPENYKTYFSMEYIFKQNILNFSFNNSALPQI